MYVYPNCVSNNLVSCERYTKGDREEPEIKGSHPETPKQNSNFNF